MNEERKHEKHLRIKNRITPIFYIIISFVGVILVGSVLLVLPVASADHENSLTYIDAFFLAVSAVCVTGLSPVVVATALSVFGKIVLALLIQIGGLGLVTIISFIMFATGAKINISQAMVVKEALSQPGFKNIKPLIKHIFIITFIFEICGTVMNMFVFTADYPFWEALGISIFHAISSFNNAGFDIIGAESMVPYANNILLNFSTCLLIICGGLGFLVYEDLFFFRKWRKFSTQTRVVLIINLLLLFSSIFIIYALEYNEITFMQAVFYAVNLRTAGFTTFNNAAVLRHSAIVTSLFFMLVGGSPLSTAGGIKTTTIYVIFASMTSFVSGKKTVVRHRQIPDETKIKAFFLFAFAVLEVCFGTFLIFILENERFSFETVIYETVSAFGTVGLSLGVTPYLSAGSKLVLCFIMFTGRVGPSALISAFNIKPYKPDRGNVEFLGVDLMVG